MFDITLYEFILVFCGNNLLLGIVRHVLGCELGVLMSATCYSSRKIQTVLSTFLCNLESRRTEIFSSDIVW